MALKSKFGFFPKDCLDLKHFMYSDHILITLNVSEECSEKGGKSEGSCAEGYGVCCSCK